MTILNAGERRLDGLWFTDEVVASKLTVDLPTTTWATMLRVVVPVTAGDQLDITAWARVTNDTGYTVGVGWHLWQYDVDDGVPSADRVWERIGLSCGDNVDKPRHHMPLAITSVYQVPDDWPGGHRMVVVLRADAHSTAAVAGDFLTVDKVGGLTVRRWSPSQEVPSGQLAP